MRIRRAIVCLVLLIGPLATGCSHWSKITAKSVGWDGFTRVERGGTVPAVLANVTTTVNGAETSPSQDFVQHLKQKLGATGLFSSVRSAIDSGGSEDAVEFSIQVTETIGAKEAKNFWRGFLIGLSFYTLTGVLPLEMDFESKMTLEATRPDGDTASFDSYSKGTAYFHLFGNAALAGIDVGAKVTGNNLNSLMSQVVQDAEWFRE